MKHPITGPVVRGEVPLCDYHRPVLASCAALSHVDLDAARENAISIAAQCKDCPKPEERP